MITGKKSTVVSELIELAGILSETKDGMRKAEILDDILSIIMVNMWLIYNNDEYKNILISMMDNFIKEEYKLGLIILDRYLDSIYDEINYDKIKPRPELYHFDFKTLYNENNSKMFICKKFYHYKLNMKLVYYK